MEEEDRRIQEYGRLKQEREDQLMQKKAADESHRNELYMRMAHDMNNSENFKREMENVRLELYIEQQEEAGRERERKLLEKRIRDRLELLDAFQAQKEEKIRLQEQEREDENAFRHMLLEKFANEEKIEQMNAQKKRMKQLEHRKAVEELIQERREKRAKELEERSKGIAENAEFETYRLQVIEQERQRLLREHAAKLTGYLPKGVIRDEKDLDCFDDEFKNLVLSKRAADQDLL
jgi:hypothetical protein